MVIANLPRFVPNSRETRDHPEVWKRLEEWGGTLIFLALDPFMALPMAGLLPPSQAVVVAWDNGYAVKQLEASKLKVLVVGHELPGRRSTDRLLDHPRVQALINQQASHGPVAILAFKPNARLQKAIRSLGFDSERVRLLSSPIAIGRTFENKLRFPELVADFAIPVPTYEIVKPSEGCSFDDLKGRFGKRFVVQSGAGFSGAGTHLVESKEDWLRVISPRPERKFKVSRFITGVSLTLNACVLGPDQPPVIGEVMEQLTGCRSLTPYPLGACGNVWGAPACPPAMRGRARQLTAQVGRALAQEGYRGHYGVDLMAEDSGHVVVIECNPRFTATLPVDALVSRLRREASLFALHILGSLALDTDGLCERLPGPAMTQYIYRHRGEPVCLEARCWTSYGPGQPHSNIGTTSFLTEQNLAAGAAFFLSAAGGRRVEQGMETGRLIVLHESCEKQKKWALNLLLNSVKEKHIDSVPAAG
jgi:hypothetical protein